MSDLDARVVEEFRANAGRVGGPLRDTPLLLLHHVGARSGIERVTPLAWTLLPDGIVVVASNAGSPAHPAWYHNLKAHPRVVVELGGETFAADAVELDGSARDAVWPDLVAAAPAVGRYQAGIVRRIPVLLLQRVP